MRITVLLAAILTIAGCASSTGVVPTGPDSFMVANHGVMGYSSAGAQKAQAFQLASDYCRNLGKNMHPINTAESPSGFGKIASAEVAFKCEPERK